MKKIFVLWACLAVLLGAPAYAGELPKTREAIVHDPSVIEAGGTFYIYGSHMAAAKSMDLIDWQMISTDAKHGCKLVEDVQTQMSEALTWARTTTFWAGDVERLADGRYYMYYCTCEGTSPLSALGLAVADSPEGPFTDLGVFLKSGMGGAGEDGAKYDATVHPNVIDPHTFHDADGRLWMVYGSYSGGIYILRMDEATGLPAPGQGYGKRLLGANHARIEGPYILYAPETGYYYLFLSFGGLDKDGGYNIRVCRSRNPDGPYEDALGQPMADCGGAPGSFFDDAAIEPYGLKLVGGFRYEAMDGEKQPSDANYLSPGHNSAIRLGDGRYMLLFHTRFAKLGSQHRVRVHEFWFDADGWPLVSPLRYRGAPPQPDTEAAGEYRVIRHGTDINKQPHESLRMTLDGTSKLALDGTEFRGTATVGYDPIQGAWVRALTMRAGNESLWAVRRE